MSSEDLDIAAFPVAVPERWYATQDGMGLRDWFAGQALVGVIARPSHLRVTDAKLIAEQAYLIAQAMLVVRQKYEENSQ